MTIRENPAAGAASGVTRWTGRMRPKIPPSQSYAVYIAFVAILVFFAVDLRGQGFTSSTNVLNIGRSTATTSVMAVATVFVLSAAEIDLSIGSTVALAAVSSALVTQHHGAVAGVIAGLLVGVAVGLFNGVIVTALRLPSFLVTLGTQMIGAGLARSISNLQAVPVSSRGYIRLLGGGSYGGIETVYLWTAAVVILGHIVYRLTPFGRAVLATGGSRVAARFSGVRTARVKILVFVLSGAAAAGAGMLDTGRLGGARYDFGSSDLLIVLAAVVIGGTSLFGGKGSVIGALIGSLLIGALTNGLILMNISVSNQMVAQGAVIILAVALGSRAPNTGGRGLARLRFSLSRWPALRPPGAGGGPTSSSPTSGESA